MIAIRHDLSELRRFRYVAFNLVMRDLRARYQDSFLGFLWTLLYPAILLAIWVSVFGVIMRFGAEDYWAFLLSGLLPFQFLQSAISEGSSAVRRNAGLIRKIYIPPEVLVVSAVTVRLVEFLLQLALAIGVLVLWHGADETGRAVSIPLSISVLPAAILLTYLVALGIALPLAAWSVIYRDLEHITGAALMAWLYLTPVFWIFNEETTQVWMRPLGLNPAMYLLDLFRGPLYYGRSPENPLVGGPLALLMLNTLIAVLIFLGGYLLFRRSKHVLAEVV